MRTLVACSLIALLSLTACSASGSSKPSPEASPPATPDADVARRADYPERVRLVTLGDAYTAGVGTDAPKRDSWPAQLAQALGRGDVRLWVMNLASGGRTSEQVLDEQLGQVAGHEPDVVTLQVGVNDIMTGDTERYRDNVSVILDELLLLLPPERIFVITTPDHSLTEWGAVYGPREVARAAVADLNRTLGEVADERAIGVIDIGLINELVVGDSSLVVSAEYPLPYPTAKQYAGWVEVIGPHIHAAIFADGP